MKQNYFFGQASKIKISAALTAFLVVGLFFVNTTDALAKARQVSIEGKFVVYHGDNLTSGTSSENYTLEDYKGTIYDIQFTDADKAENTLISLSGSKVTISGTLITKTDIVSSSSQIKQLAPAAGLSVSGAKKVAVILFNFQNNTSQPWTNAEVGDITFTSSTSANAYYQDISSGSLSLTGKVNSTGDVYGWYTIAYDSGPSCSAGVWSAAAKTAAQNAGADLTGYDEFIYAFPQTSACSWVGLGTLTSTPGEVWVNGFYKTSLVGHEIGHNFNLLHANSYNCVNGEGGPRVTFSNNCTPVEYGDPFDIMGTTEFINGSYSPNHMSTYYKGKLGFLSGGNLQTVTTTGNYTLVPQENHSTGVKSIRVPRDYDGLGNVTRYYYLEFRQSIGNFHNFISSDPVANGVSIRLAGPYDVSPVENSFLLDATPSTTTFNDSALAQGQTFTDPLNGVSFTTQSVSGTSATITITIPDTTPPSTPANLIATNPPGVRRADLSWDASTDNVGVTGYWIYRDSEFLDISSTNSYTDTTVVEGVTYNYNVQAVDAANNFSNSSNFVEFTFLGDTVAPAITITAPNNNQSVTGIVNITSNATDNVAVTSVGLYRNGQLVDNSILTPFDFSWNTDQFAEGSYTLQTVAWDAANNSSSSPMITVFVDRTNPVTSITSPTNGANVSGNVTISANATDSGGINRVEFYRDNFILLSTDTSYPYSITWNSDGVAVGNHSLYVKAYDTLEHQTISSIVNVNVLDVTPPTTAITSPTDGAIVPKNAVTTIQATASDNDGLSRVEFYVNGVYKGVDTTAPYTYAWSVPRQRNTPYQLQTKAFDLTQNIGWSSVVNVTSSN